MNDNREPEMLTARDLAQVGRGTPAGEWFRRYWMVAARSDDLRDIPMRVRVLGEDLVLFRDGAGRLGLLGLHCPHRGTSLEYGDVGPSGLRCPYHGWLFDISGACLEQPAEPPGSVFHEKVRHLSYPVRELGGLIFAYLGPPDHEPPLPQYAPLAEPGGQRRIEAARHYDYNWYNFIENGADPAHFSTLHLSDPDDGTWRSWFFNARDVPPFDAVETDYGMKVVSRKPAAEKGLSYVDEKSYALPSVMQIGDTEFTHFKEPREALARGSSNAHWMFVTPDDDDHFTLYTVDHYTGPDPDFMTRLAPSRRPVATAEKPEHDHRPLSPYRGSVRLEDIMTQSTQGNVACRQ
ncbi:MAG: Rieske 2Fe-2S domain-containing protein, partial [Deltaproteobacteria bacterium]|nr:Rieske 2Fe-2S domain-containing protein [Deltaproteobacteria bacterium]